MGFQEEINRTAAVASDRIERSLTTPLPKFDEDGAFQSFHITVTADMQTAGSVSAETDFSFIGYRNFDVFSATGAKKTGDIRLSVSGGTVTVSNGTVTLAAGDTVEILVRGRK